MIRALWLVCGVGALASVSGLDDDVSLLQAEKRTPLGAGTDEADHIETLRALLGDKNVQNAVAREAAKVPLQSAVERLARLVDNGSVDAALAGGVHGVVPHDLEDSPKPPELVLVEDEMRNALRKWAPSSPDTALLLQQLGAHEGGNFSVPVEAAERMQEQLASAGEAWRQNSAAHDEILSYLPKLYRLVSNPDHFEPLKSAFGSLRGQNASTVEVLADHFPRLVGYGASALRSLGLKDGDVPAGDRWKPEAGFDPYVRFATHHGVKYRPLSKVGPTWTLTGGFKNHYYTSQVLKEKLMSLEFNKVVIRVGCMYEWESGDGVMAQFQLDFESPGLSKSVFSPFKQAALTLRYFKKDSWTKKSKTGYEASYTTTTQFGPGLQYNIKPPQNSFKDTWGDVLGTFDYDSKDKTKDWKGVNINLCARLGFDRDSDFANKAFVFSKWRVLPESRRQNPDIRIRIFAAKNKPKK